MKKLLIGIAMSISISGCKNESNSELTKETSSKWPNINFDTLPAPDFSIDNQKGSLKDSIRVMYKDSTILRHRTIVIDSILYYVVEGDMLLNEYKYNQYRISKVLGQAKQIEQGVLVGEMINGKPSRWPENEDIRFCINRKSFSNSNNYNLIKDNISKAIGEWMKVCNATFKYLPEFDNSDYFHGNDKVDFVVLEYDANGAFIAKAFFPYYAANERNVIIDPSYYASNFDKVGVFRHELGHVLGFRHEHIVSQAPPACPDEITQGIFSFTQYDPKSVMHYFCGGVGTKELRITDLDKKGAAELYGPSNQ